ncbi:MAG: GvpL/GvpF family gas vesicle protein [Myxococcota bacterium]|jgi:hypothetical protein
MRTTQYVQTVTLGVLSALVSEPRDESPVDRALRHDRIVQRAIARYGSVVPFRAGTVLESVEAVVQLLDSNTGLLVLQLARFTNRVEMGLKAAFDPTVTTALDRQAFDHWVARSLSQLADERRERVQDVGNKAIFDAAYLMSLERVAEFCAAVREGRSRHPSVPVIVTGPWAPYSFCDFALSV